MSEQGINAAAEAIRELLSWQAFQVAADKLSVGDWAHVAAVNAVEAYLKLAAA